MPKPIRVSRLLLSTLATALVSAGLSGCDGGPALDLANDTTGVTATPVSSELPLPDPVLTPAQRRDAALSAFLASRQVTEVPEYRAASADLDADGVEDLLMLLDDPNWCTGDGCSLLVFRGVDDADTGYQLVSQTAMAHVPVALGGQRHHGWHDLLIGVGGGDTQAGTVALQFNGDGYPADPTLLAFLAVGATPRAQVLIE